ncbi:curli production assembly/transport component CsgF [Hymenobacter busanensis]|uniref:Curli production assembly/transport component CsgF n=1 Tax=Hymenobacter busanensis TaxID=2607656 RepID=A0A7L4ZSJ4_9BACT|nr:curli production assembly/transport component CsgF [Hymenobacter busanensis]KAA9327177.1 curli production assembly/transport component CsgF [Hymenobacter busanensis]QHJ05843.1 curli production assembly/transport component CsgF [Hymenobacter busanensis]
MKTLLRFSHSFVVLAALCALALLAPRPLAAQDLVYEPKNPSFGGGNTFNYSWLLSSAQAQNKIEDKSTKSLLERDPLKEFEQSMNQQILSQLSRQLITSQFGETGIKEGTYNIGAYQINVTPGNNGISVQITDSGTGNQTTVVIPFF